MTSAACPVPIVPRRGRARTNQPAPPGPALKRVDAETMQTYNIYTQASISVLPSNHYLILYEYLYITTVFNDYELVTNPM